MRKKYRAGIRASCFHVDFQYTTDRPMRWNMGRRGKRTAGYKEDVCFRPPSPHSFNYRDAPRGSFGTPSWIFCTSKFMIISVILVFNYFSSCTPNIKRISSDILTLNSRRIVGECNVSLEWNSSYLRTDRVLFCHCSEGIAMKTFGWLHFLTTRRDLFQSGCNLWLYVIKVTVAWWLTPGSKKTTNCKNNKKAPLIKKQKAKRLSDSLPIGNISWIQTDTSSSRSCSV